ncbi:MAG: LytTR family DNA-binding domain-containing protein [Gemmatimonadota bacterium]
MTKPHRVVVVDDEPLARRGIVSLLRDDPEIEVVAECGDGRSAVTAIRERSPDLVLLDVQMPELDGFGVIDQVGPAEMPAVVFVTAYDQFALKAFEVSAVDYLLKPFDDARFHAAIARAKAAITREDTTAMGVKLLRLLQAAEPADRQAQYLSRIVVKTGAATHFVKVDDIDWIEAADYCSKLHLPGRSYVVRESMSHFEERLDPTRFFRAHRSTIVNLDRIKELQPYFKGDHVLVLADGTKLQLSKSRRGRLEAILGQSL